MYQFSNDKPIFEQIMDYIVVKIASGHYLQGERILSVREYAVKLGVNPNTVQRALSELEREGIICSKRGDGRFVCDQEKAKELRDQIAKNNAKKFTYELERMGFTKEEIIELVKEVEL